MAISGCLLMQESGSKQGEEGEVPHRSDYPSLRHHSLAEFAGPTWSAISYAANAGPTRVFAHSVLRGHQLVPMATLCLAIVARL